MWLSCMAPLNTLHQEIIHCRQCPRLVSWRETVATEKVKRFQDDTYWGRGVPGFGDPHARLLIVGLAPAAHGANRTGRMFTGDNSGLWLYRALHKAGFANQAESTHRDDGLTLLDCFITATVHCAPPDNKPTREEIAACTPFLARELQAMAQVKAILCLGNLALGETYKLLKNQLNAPTVSGKSPKFEHGGVFPLTNGQCLFTSYHPSQQNTFTGRLTEAMFDEIFTTLRQFLETDGEGSGRGE